MAKACGLPYRARSSARDFTLQSLVAGLVAARKTAHLTQQDVAFRMSTTRSAVARLENAHTRPTLTTIEKYAFAVGASLEIRVRRG